MALDELEDVERDLDDQLRPNDINAGRSNIDRIRQRHARRSHHLDLPIPEWGGDVVVRYGRVPPRTLRAAARRKGNPTHSNAQLLVAACKEILILGDDGELHPAAEADGLPTPIRFDGRLADLFDINETDSVAIAVRMYADDIAIGRATQRLFAWQTGEDLDTFGPDEVEEGADGAGEA